MNQSREIDTSGNKILPPSSPFIHPISLTCKKPEFEIIYIKEKHLESDNFSSQIDSDSDVIKKPISNETDIPNKKKTTIIAHVEEDSKGEDEEEKKRRLAEKDKEPNFFANGEGFRFARNSLFYLDESSLLRNFIINKILYTTYFQGSLLFFLLLNLVAYGLYNFSYRTTENVSFEYYQNNYHAYIIEIICSIFFTFEICLRLVSVGIIFEPYCYLRSREGVFNFVIYLLNWFFLIEPDEYNVIWSLKALRMVRIFRILFVFKKMRLTVVSLINAIPSMARTFYCLLIVFMFYTIWGLHFFSGLEEYRCRTTPEPTLINGTLSWPSAGIDFHCGYWECPKGTYCGSPYDYNMPFDDSEMNIEFLNYGVTNFQNFFQSLLIVLHFIFLAGWSNHTYTIWRASDGVITCFFFGSLVIIGYFIMVNLFLAGVYDSFMMHSSIKDKKKHVEKDQNEVKEIKKETNFFANLGEISKKETVLSIKEKPREDPSLKAELNINKSVQSPVYLASFSESTFQKYRNLWKEKVLRIFHNIWVRRLISVLIITDIGVLCSDGHPISRSSMILIQQIDFAFFCIFFIEVTIRLSATSLKQLKTSWLLWIDIFVIYANLFVLIYEVNNGYNIFEEGSSVGIGIKTMKMVRIFRIIYYCQIFSSLSFLMRALATTLLKMKSFLFIMLVVMVVFALIGMRLFGQKARFYDLNSGGLIFNMNGTPARPNFDDFFNSLVSIILVVYNEEWHISMYKHYLAVGTISFFYFIFVIFVANIIMMKLLVAVFLNNFIQQIKSKIIQDQTHVMALLKKAFLKKRETIVKYLSNSLSPRSPEQPIKSRFSKFKQGLMIKLQDYSEKLSLHNEVYSPDKPNFLASIKELSKKDVLNVSDQPPKKKNRKSEFLKEKISELKNKSLCLFPLDSRIRKFLTRILEHWAFETFMLFVIFFSSLILVLQNPFEDPNDYVQVLLRNFDQIVAIIYGIEFVINIIAFGFFMGPTTYLRRSAWNILDFGIFIFTLVGVILSTQMRYTSMKVFRTIRILKIGQKNPGIRVATQALMAALPNIIRLLCFSLIFILCFALYGMRYLKSQYYYCTSLEKSILNIVLTKQDCMDYSGDWVRHDMHFDSIFAAVSTLFQIATSEGWLYEMYKAVDSSASDDQPHWNSNQYWMIFFLAYFFVGNFMVMNMFIGVIGETYLSQKSRANKFDLLTDEQKEWALIKTSILAMKPNKMKSVLKYKFQEKINKFRKWKPFKYLYYLCICFNILILTLYYHRQPKETTKILNQINISMIIFFTFFFFLRICCINSLKTFLLSKNTIVSIVTLSFSYASYGIDDSDRVLNSLAKASQTFMGYHILKKFNIVQRLFHTILFVLPSLSNIVSFMLLILYIYTIIGMDIFAYLRPQKAVNGYDVDFKTFPRALFSLFRVMSAESWFLIVSDCIRERSPNFACADVYTYADYVKYGVNGCGSSYNYFFFYTYMIFFSLILLNLFIVNILVSYGEVFNAEQRAIDRFQLSKIDDLWAHFDPLANGFINYKDFWTLASKIAVVFGVSEKDLLDVQNKKNFIKILKIPLYESIKKKVFCYRFHDVIVRLAEISVTIKYGVVE